MQSIQFDSTDKMYRKIWLGLTLFPISFWLVEYVQTGELQLHLYLVQSLFMAVFIYCAYLKYGNTLLTFTMALTFLSLMIQGFWFLNNDPMLKELNSIPLAYSLPYSIAWLFVSFKLLKINKKAARQLLRFSPSYKDALAYFQGVSTLDELNKKYKDLLFLKPEIALVINEAFKTKKGELHVDFD